MKQESDENSHHTRSLVNQGKSTADQNILAIEQNILKPVADQDKITFVSRQVEVIIIIIILSTWMLHN